MNKTLNCSVLLIFKNTQSKDATEKTDMDKQYMQKKISCRNTVHIHQKIEWWFVCCKLPTKEPKHVCVRMWPTKLYYKAQRARCTGAYTYA